ncbi:protein LNK3-like isoform X2 [Telopea speciosissima]|uniref:protein LNK3-like isoform X2 n=1 Tax=Telopea speciosissima TaxID=54955 RepID=UPI001CC371D4|nr:protein LNK3-like isoform X2 [Telopea speciosissima]
MDGYVGLEADSFGVSKRQKPSLRYPSQEYCLPWGVAISESFGSPNEYCIGATNLKSEELNFNGKGSPNEFEAETSIPGESSTESSWCEGFSFVDRSRMNPEASLDGTRHLDNRPDYQLDGIGGIDHQTDDIFLRSLLEETPPGMENPYRSVSMYPVSDCSAMPSKNILTGMIVDSQSISVDTSTTNSSKNLNRLTHCFPSSADWDRVENMPNFMPADSGKMEDCSMKKEPAVPGLIPAELSSPYKGEGHLNAGRSLEESVLQELELAMAQLTKRTRLCFRDALYRLAKSSEQPHVVSQTRSGEITMEKHSLSPVPYRTSRFQSVNATDYQTNTIDWTIEKLMFDKLDCDTADLSSDVSVNLSKETVMMEGSTSYGLNWTSIPQYSRCSLLPQDAGNLILGGENNIMINF